MRCFSAIHLNKASSNSIFDNWELAALTINEPLVPICLMAFPTWSFAELADEIFLISTLVPLTKEISRMNTVRFIYFWDVIYGLDLICF